MSFFPYFFLTLNFTGLFFNFERQEKTTLLLLVSRKDFLLSVGLVRETIWGHCPFEGEHSVPSVLVWESRSKHYKVIELNTHFTARAGIMNTNFWHVVQTLYSTYSWINCPVYVLIAPFSFIVRLLPTEKSPKKWGGGGRPHRHFSGYKLVRLSTKPFLLSDTIWRWHVLKALSHEIKMGYVIYMQMNET